MGGARWWKHVQLELGKPEKAPGVEEPPRDGCPAMAEIDVNSSAVQAHVAILQGVIGRMAANSAAGKTWCVGLVSGIVVLLVSRGSPDFLWVALIPLALFAFLDAFYLGLERRFRAQYNAFIYKLHDGTATVGDLYVVTPDDKGFWEGLRFFLGSTIGAFFSVSVWPFYGLLAGMLFILQNRLT